MVSFAVAFGLVLVLEGAAYALFPCGMKKMLLSFQQMSPVMIRGSGLLLAILGALIIWLVTSR